MMITVVLIIIWWQRGGDYSPGFVTNIGGFYNYWVATPIYGCVDACERPQRAQIRSSSAFQPLSMSGAASRASSDQ